MNIAEESLTFEARTWLLRLARTSIQTHLEERRFLEPNAHPRGVKAHRGCFVTLHLATGALRGCIGTFSSEEALWKNVHQMAIASATRDPRFEPLALKELSLCQLEISALTAPKTASAQDIEVGVHGLCITRGFRRGVLLPQVPLQHGWDRERFLEQTCMKAGLSPTAWKDSEVGIETFTAEVFSEEPS